MDFLVWPDGSWVAAQDYDDFADAWRGDDFVRIDVAPYQDIDVMAAAAVGLLP